MGDTIAVCWLTGFISFVNDLCIGGFMTEVYMFEASIVKISGDRYVIYPPKEYQEKLRKHYGKRVKVLVVIETE